MAKTVLMPKLGLTMSEGTIIKWRFEDGDNVKTGDVLFELETDKMVNEVISEVDGVLHIILREGSVAPVAATVGIIAGFDEDISGVLT